jgi:hypothetical protein
MTGFVDPNTIQNAAAGQPLQSARLDADRDALMYLATNHAHARVYNIGSISIPDVTWTSLTFNSERVDISAMHSTSSNTGRLTVPSGEGGWYDLGGHAQFTTSAGGVARMIRIRLNGTTLLASAPGGPISASFNAYCTVTTKYLLAAGDYVELQVFQNSGGALNCITAANESPEFFAEWSATQ